MCGFYYWHDGYAVTLTSSFATSTHTHAHTQLIWSRAYASTIWVLFALYFVIFSKQFVVGTPAIEVIIVFFSSFIPDGTVPLTKKNRSNANREYFGELCAGRLKNLVIGTSINWIGSEWNQDWKCIPATGCYVLRKTKQKHTCVCKAPITKIETKTKPKIELEVRRNMRRNSVKKITILNWLLVYSVWPSFKWTKQLFLIISVPNDNNLLAENQSILYRNRLNSAKQFCSRNVQYDYLLNWLWLRLMERSYKQDE